MANLYRDKNLSAPLIAEIAGCKEPDDKTTERVRKYLKSHNLWRNSGGQDAKE
jgi:hypothetical protein